MHVEQNKTAAKVRIALEGELNTVVATSTDGYARDRWAENSAPYPLPEIGRRTSLTLPERSNLRLVAIVATLLSDRFAHRNPWIWAARSGRKV